MTSSQRGIHLLGCEPRLASEWNSHRRWNTGSSTFPRGPHGRSCTAYLGSPASTGSVGEAETRTVPKKFHVMLLLLAQDHTPGATVFSHNSQGDTFPVSALRRSLTSLCALGNSFSPKKSSVWLLVCVLLFFVSFEIIFRFMFLFDSKFKSFRKVRSRALPQSVAA